MDNNSAFQTQPAYVQKTSNHKRLIIIFLVVLVLMIVALSALYLLGSSAKKPPVQPTAPIPTQIPVKPTPASASATLSPIAGVSVTPNPKSSPTPALTSLSVSVLNGSGTPGAAGQTASALKSAGFTNVTTGNASVYTYTGITVHVKDKNNLAAVEKAVQDANPNVKVTTGVDPTLSSDVEVIVGK